MMRAAINNGDLALKLKGEKVTLKVESLLHKTRAYNNCCRLRLRAIEEFLGSF